MNIAEGLILAFAGLSANRLRSSLTMLGILIGVAAVILLVAFGNGTSVAVQKQVESLGSNVIYVYPSSSRVGGVAQGFGTAQTLTQDDVTALNDHSQAPDIVTAIPLTTAAGTMTYRIKTGPPRRAVPRRTGRRCATTTSQRGPSSAPATYAAAPEWWCWARR